MADFAVRYTDFSGGYAGNVDASNVPARQWLGSDAELYMSGLVGPRAGLKALPVTGLPAANVAGGPIGFDVFGANLAICVRDTYLVPMAGGAAVQQGAYPAPAVTGPVQYAQGNNALYSLMGGQVFKHAPGAGVLSPIATPEPFRLLDRWNYNLIAIGANNPYRLYYTDVTSAGSNFDSWSPNNYLDIGTDPVTSLNPIHNALYVGKGSGWWVVSGVLGTQSFVRSVQQGAGPLDARQCRVTIDGRLLYYPSDPTPMWFNGVWSRLEPQFRIPVTAPIPVCPTDSVVVMPTAERIFLAADNGVNTNVLSGIGHWSRYQWVGHWGGLLLPYRIGGMVPSDPRYGYQMPSLVGYITKRTATVGDPIVIWSWQHDVDRPALASDPWAAPIDDGQSAPVTATFSPGAWFDGQGRQVVVRAVIIQFRKWNLGVNVDNILTCRVDTQGRYSGGSNTGEVHVWAEPTSRSSPTGTDDSWRIGFGEQGPGNGFQVTLTMAGVAVKEIVVMCTLRGDRLGA